MSRTGVARLFRSRAKFEDYFLSWTALFEITDLKAGKNLVLLILFLTVFDQISHNRKRSKGHENKLEGRNFAMSGVGSISTTF